ncbi:MAG: Asp-tRNA(Asn)/Glu-tRNA(Gln) amidotransferase subunit GatA [Rhodospirillales bacterium]|nr:Asp-tRNA(Asn)/Glu-tRNA(Gln) amidotransferase subunit GatA [Rhodospirillales bacterium]MCB9965260.1 Asp-tRNA(Asn)/Glu-tRNA(Gln) amidotransferase subunit GatA [Rhodospirillales bacterium]MCB9972970.1 Asp-tRNA(Asn)/Glu-tRNA(Gln) amidotransferase subunit GatA [Rhodospirillales bacterium]MCB9980042.1 Asp-tRNA(Asn)/Glu-tRNA(Gln) amidotransferase subunit GatA [Rhodospirillales bacterium]
MSSISDLTLDQTRRKLLSKELSAKDVTDHYLSRMEVYKSLNAYITETPDLAQKQAAESDARLANGTARPLEGIPIGMKDLFCTEGIRTTAGSKILGNFVPHYESTVSRKLRDAGTIMLGKTNLDEFAMGSSNTTSAYGNTISPWRRKNGGNEELVPGGSSGGSSAAVSAKLCLGATGTDTGGSIRQPASFCGIVGIKPTYGRCSRWGIIAYASSLDQAGVFAETVKDTALLLEACSGFDPRDSTSANLPVPDFSAALTGDVRGLRIGIPKEYRVDNMPEEIEKLWQQGIDWLKSAGAEIVEVSLPHTKYALPTYYIIAPAEASSNLARYDGVRYGVRQDKPALIDMYEATRAAGFGDEVKRRIMIGTYVLSAGYYDAYYIKAQQVRRLIRQDFINAFEKCDALLTPATPSAAFAIGENEDDPVKMYLNDVFTVSLNLAGLPGMSVPAGLDSQGLPLGLQIIGKAWDEETIFKVGGVLENAANFKAKPFQ